MGRRNRNWREQRGRQQLHGRSLDDYYDEKLSNVQRREHSERTRYRDKDALGVAPARQNRAAPRTRDDEFVPRSAEPFLAAMSQLQATPACGSCRNWLADGLPGGRGACDHPGSGFMYPFLDTPACPFYDGQ